MLLHPSHHSRAAPSMISRRMLCAAAALLPLPALAETSDPKFAAWLRGVRAEALKAGVDQGTLDARAGLGRGGAAGDGARAQPARIQDDVRQVSRGRRLERARQPRPRAAEGEPRRGRPLRRTGRHARRRSSSPCGASRATTARGSATSRSWRRWRRSPTTASAPSSSASQLIAALKIVSQGHIGLHAMKGSWAGAMGQCQFIPTSFLAYAADGDGDGRMDIWTNKADVFASIVNYLQQGRLASRPVVGRGSAGRHGGGAGHAHRAAGRRQRAGVPHDREFPGHPALESVGFLRPGRRTPVRQDRRVTAATRQPPRRPQDHV